jgi:uncharacterized metal-binding protein
MLSVRFHSKVALGRSPGHGHPQSVFQNNSVLPDRVVNTMANSPICRTQIVTISIFNEVVMVLLGVLVDAKSHSVAGLYSPQIRKRDTQSQLAEAIMATATCFLPPLNE